MEKFHFNWPAISFSACRVAVNFADDVHLCPVCVDVNARDPNILSDKYTKKIDDYYLTERNQGIKHE